MKRITDNLDFLLPIIKCISSQFGSNCEVVLHDLKKGLENSIIAIENGHVTGRKIGDPSSNLGLEVLRGTNVNGDKYNYITQTTTGKTLRSSSIYLKDKNNKVIGALCINLDISKFMIAEKAIQSITNNSFQNTNPQTNSVNEIFVNDVNQLFEHFIQECMKEIKTPVINMTKKDKMNCIKYFDDRGAFLIKKSSEKICEFLNISKYTLYAYLGEIKGENFDKL